MNTLRTKSTERDSRFGLARSVLSNQFEYS